MLCVRAGAGRAAGRLGRGALGAVLGRDGARARSLQVRHVGTTPALARGARPRTHSSVTLLCPETGSKQAPSGFLAYLYRVQVFKYLLLAFIGVRARFIFNVPVFMDSRTCIFLTRAQLN